MKYVKYFISRRRKRNKVRTSHGNSNLSKYAKKGITLIGDGVAYCDTLIYGFDKWIIEKMDFTKGVNEKLK